MIESKGYRRSSRREDLIQDACRRIICSWGQRNKPALRNRLVDTSRAIGDVKKRNHADHGAKRAGAQAQIDYIDKVPYRVADTTSTVNGKGRNIKSPVEAVGRLCMHVRVYRPRCAQIDRKWSWERYRCVKAKTGFRGARPARWRVGVYKVFDTS